MLPPKELPWFVLMYLADSNETVLLSAELIIGG
jgi:hypothetical protein